MQNLTPLDMQTVQKFNTNMAIVFKQIKENQTIEIAHIEYLRNITAYFKKIYEEKDESLFGSYVKVENYINRQFTNEVQFYS